MEETSMSEERRWVAHPVAGRAVALVAFLIPVVASLAAVFAMNAVLPPPTRASSRLIWWFLVVAAGIAPIPPLLYVARRLLPLSMLLRIGLVFPDKAPSRFEVAKRAHRTRDLQRELAASAPSTADDRMHAAATVLALVAAVEDHDRGTRGHSERVRVLTDLIADEMGLPDDDKEKLRWAALLHDVGKLSVPGEILNKPGRPDADEWEVLRRHPSFGVHIMGPLRSWLGQWVSAVEQHHERFDGSGYPRGLAGDGISLGGRIVAVADSYEVMTAARPYKKSMSVGTARGELVRVAGKHFDPDVVRTFLGISLGRLRWVVGIGALLAQIPVLSQLSYRGIVQKVGRGVGTAASTAAAVVAITIAGPVDLAGLRPGLGDPGTPRTSIAAPDAELDAPVSVSLPRANNGGSESDVTPDGEPETLPLGGDQPAAGTEPDEPPPSEDGEPPDDDAPDEPEPPPPPEDEDDCHLVQLHFERDTPVGHIDVTIAIECGTPLPA